MNDWLSSAAPFAIAFSLTFAACSSDSSPAPTNDDPNINIGPMSSEGGQLGVFNPNATRDVFACEAPYYVQLRGTYFGNVTHTDSNNATCEWRVNLKVRGGYADVDDPDSTAQCVISANYQYELVSGSTSCVDGNLTAPMLDPLVNPVDLNTWEIPPWPQNVNMQLAPSIDDGTILPLSTIAGDARNMVWQFDGLGDVIAVDDNAVDGTVNGILVKR